MPKKIVLAYSGGLDTSVILKWLQNKYKCPVVTFTADIGQGDELKPIESKAKSLGVKEIFIENLQEEILELKNQISILEKEKSNILEELKKSGWLENKVTDQSSDSEFFRGTEATTSSSSNWNAVRNMQGSSRTILWDAPSSELTAKCELRGSNLLLTGTFTIS